MRYILGIDGGGSKTTAILADSAGRVIGSGEGRASNYQTIGLDSACNSITTAMMAAIDGAVAASHIGPTDLDGRLIVVLGLAGADRSQDKTRLKSALTAKLPIKPAMLRMENDARIALAGATGNEPGIILIAGTGSIALGMDHEGRRVRVGGWGPVLGDEGSGYSIGKAALIAVLREYDRRGQPTSLTDRLLSHLGITSPEELISLVYQGPLQRPEIAKLAEIVLEEAAQGDAVGQCLVDTAARQLVDMIGAVLRRLDREDKPTTIAGIGGLLRPGNLMWETITQILAEVYPQSRLAPPLLPPELGAILLGRDYLDRASPHLEFIRNLTLYSHAL